MCFTPIAARALALLDDLRDRGRSGREIGHRDQLRQVKELGGRLGTRRTDEHRLLAEACDQGLEPVANATVEVADRRVFLTARHGLLGCQRLARGCGWNEAPGVLTLHPLGPLEIQKMQQRLLTKRQQVHLDRRRKVTRALREVGPPERRRGADSRGQVGDQGQVQHLVDGDAVQRFAPPINNLCLLDGETIVGALFEAKRPQRDTGT